MEAISVSEDDAELLVLEAVRRGRMNGGTGTAAEVARALGHDDHAAVRRTLDALVASGQLEYERVDDLCADCDWPAAPFDAYRLTRWGEAALAAVGTRGRAGSVPLRPAVSLEHAIELGMQAFAKTGDVRDAIIEALTSASQGGQLDGHPARAIA
jgi:hypothetical protein